MVVKELNETISDKHVVLIGSGPNPILPTYKKENTIFICLKASAYSAKKLNIPTPDITFQAYWGLGDNLKYLKNLKTKKLVQIWETNDGWGYEGYIDIYKKINYNYEKFYMFHNKYLPLFYQSELWVNKEVLLKNPISFGVGVILICLGFKAKSITLVGFDPFMFKRNYESNRHVHTVHKEPDIVTLGILSKEFKNIYTTNKSLSEKIADLKYKE